jgi:hypothetical protein
MSIERVHSFLVHPAKNEEIQPEISGTAIHRQGPLYDMLSKLFERAHEECDIDVVFRPDDKGRQHNECRNLLTEYMNGPSIAGGRALARRLQSITTHRSGLGLLFLMKGRIGERHQLVISRFPADQGVIAEERAQQLSVEFIERVFMKSAKAYKSALYVSDAMPAGFWDGRAVDRQISGPRELSDYWIQDFLASDLRTTGPAGTKRLAVALRSAVRATAELRVRQELISAASLLRSQHGRRRTARQMVEQLGLSQQAVKALEANLPRADLMDEVFQFDRDEFEKHAPYRAVQLDNGGLLVAEDARFSDVFQRQTIDEAQGRVRFVTEGRVVDETLRKQK